MTHYRINGLTGGASCLHQLIKLSNDLAGGKITSRLKRPDRIVLTLGGRHSGREPLRITTDHGTSLVATGDYVNIEWELQLANPRRKREKVRP